MTGWESADFLQNAVDTCTNASGEIEDCALFNIQSDDTAAQCTFDAPDNISEDNPEGPRDGLPIGIPIQSGPSYASEYSVLSAGQTGAATSTSKQHKSSSTAESSAVVPTLTYSSATASITDKYGGGILVVSTQDGSEAAYGAASSEPSSYVASSSAAATPVSADSTVTIAPSASDAYGGDVNIVATSYITQNGQVVEMLIQEVDVTVTATATATAIATPNAKNRRHLDQHQHRRVRHAGGR